MSKKTVVIGASENPERYSHKASLALSANGHEVFPLGLREGKIDSLSILTGKPPLKDIHTVTLYVAAGKQSEWKSYVESLQPRRVIFNPGTENEEWMQALNRNHIEAIEACTLVMLSLGTF